VIEQHPSTIGVWFDPLRAFSDAEGISRAMGVNGQKRNGDPIRIAYMAERFPTLSETWINVEIRHLVRLGAIVRVFACRDPSSIEINGNLDLADCTQRFIRRPGHLDLLALTKTSGYVVGAIFGSGAKTPRLKAQVLRDYLVNAANTRAIRQFAPDFIMAHFGGRRATLAMMAAATLDVPFGIKYHAGDVFTESALEKIKIQQAALLMTISDFNLEVFKDRGTDVSRFVRHRCGVDLNDFDSDGPRAAAAQTFRIVSVGRLVPMKGFDDLVSAISQLNKKERFRKMSLEVEIIGEGPLEGELKEMISALSLDRVVRLTGPQDSAGIRRALKRASLFVLPCKAAKRGTDTRASQSSMDGIPVALIEAMACRVPVISTRLSGIPELIIDQAGGWLVESSNPPELATAIEYAMSLTHEELWTIGQQGRKRVEDEFDARALAESLLRSVSAAVDRRSVSASQSKG
jgi:colanic acid/amylovoran biosynthesis glycosyltransferase